MPVRKILFITGSRGEYGYIRPLLKLIESDPDLEYEILATNMHLLAEFGDSHSNFSTDGFKVKYKPLMTLSGYTPASMVKSLSVLGMSLADIFELAKPDFILLAGDRGEQLIAAIAGAHMNMPVAHIQAGELSGNIDGLSRHAIARFTHIHFASNEDAAARLIRSGEQSFRVFNVGAPQLDEFRSGLITSREEMIKKYPVTSRGYILLVQHSVTEQYAEAYSQITATMTAVKSLGIDAVVIAPNSDAGAALVNDAIEANISSLFHIYRNVPREDYAAFMSSAKCIVGNSSSGLLEAPSFELPAVNIGRRQDGRVKGMNVINCSHNVNDIQAAITKALDAGFRASLLGMRNPYGDGKSSERIISILKNIEIDEKLLLKAMTF